MIWLWLLLACHAGPTLATDGGIELVYDVNLEGVPADRRDEAIDQVVETIERRLDAMDAHGEVERSGDDVQVQLAGPVDMEAVQAVLGPPGRLAFMPAVDEDTKLEVLASLAGDGMLPGPVQADGDPQAARKALRAALAAVSSRVPSGFRVAFEYEEAHDRFVLHVLSESDMLTGGQVTSAHALRDDHGPYLLIQFDDSGKKALRALTTNLQGKVMAIVVDDEVLSAPRIAEPVTGGAMRLTPGSGGTHDEQLSELENLAVVFRSGALESPITLKSTQVIGPAR